MVGVGDAPLPPARHVLLAAIQFLVYDAMPVTLSLHPAYQPSVPGQMVYLNAEDMLELLPMTSRTGHDEVAFINGEVPYCETSVSGLDFGAVPVTGSVTHPVRVTNSGLVPLLLDLRIAADGPAFSLSGVSGLQTVPPGGMLDVPVTFRPTAIEAYAAELELGSTCPPIPLLGSGREAFIDWEAPELVSFDETPVGGTATRPVTITNTGEVPLYPDWELVNPARTSGSIPTGATASPSCPAIPGPAA